MHIYIIRKALSRSGGAVLLFNSNYIHEYKMKLKKVVFTALSVPLAQKTWWAYNWQKERKQEKELEIKQRVSKLNEEIKEIVDVSEIDVEGMSAEEFEKVWLYRPVRVKGGILDHEQEVLIHRPQSGEKGLEIVTPLYTSVDDNGELKGLFVDRGWLPENLASIKAHQTGARADFEGVVVFGEGKSHTGKNNDSVNKIRIDLEEFLSNPKAPQFSNRFQA